MKKRFGVSLDSWLAEQLDSVAEHLSLTRSELVERAVEEFLNDHQHYLADHECTGVLLLEGKGPSNGVESLLEDYRDIVVQYTHMHLEDVCLRVIVVRGSSTRIAELHKRLEALGCRTRYIPLPGHR